MNYELVTKNGFLIIGVELRTTNKDNVAQKEIPVFWDRFYKNNTYEKIPNKTNPDTVLGMYTDYDDAGDYSLIIGARVSNIGLLPVGMTVRTVPPAQYAVFTVRGPINEVVVKAWEYIWTTKFDFERAFTFDFEVYDLNADPENAEVSIYLAIK